MIKRRSSSVLELEAADYFKLDPDQINLLAMNNSTNRSPIASNTNSIFDGPHTDHNSNLPLSRVCTQLPKQRIFAQPGKQPQGRAKGTRDKAQKAHPTHVKAPTFTKKHGRSYGKSPVSGKTDVRSLSSSCRQSEVKLELPKRIRVQQSPIASPAPSTNSLPSVSSSPSLSPSLVCPHLSLDDILTGSGRMSESPHTIGLCSRCRLDPPPDIHSPLSPIFRPSRCSLGRSKNIAVSNPSLASFYPLQGTKNVAPSIKRGYSDQTQATVRAGRGLKQTSINNDSIDYFLEPMELKRLQMSPTLRHSVEYIRNNTTEAGRVVRIYKNGKPFDRPLRVCVMRGEFANMNHLLDHINSRQLIPLGARYLFHLDGQLVYSVEELKHNSIYVVSGTRSYDFKTNSILKEHLQLERSKASCTSSSVAQRPTRHQVSVTSTRPATDDKVRLNSSESPATESKAPRQTTKPADVRLTSAKIVKKSTPTQTKICHRAKETTTTDATSKRLVAGRARPKQQPAQRKYYKVPAGGQKSSLSKSGESLEGLAQTTGEFEASKIKPMTRAKSELSVLPTKPKKNVTFIDTGRGSSPTINVTAQSPTGPVVMIADSKEDEAKERAETSEIGIQVSDSIEGFLIDLPLPLRSAQVNGDDNSVEHQANSKSATQARAGHKGGRIAGKKPKRRIVTITEQQLSFDELDTLKDMDSGDHHSEAHKPQRVDIKLSSSGETAADETLAGDKQGEKVVQVSDDVISDRKDETTTSDQAATTTTTMVNQDEVSILSEPIKHTESSEKSEVGVSWQYPGGRPQAGASSVTPTERPVSQSDANDNVRARVLTPSPSVSTMGDSNSLAMSYEAAVVSTSSLRRRSSESINIQEAEKRQQVPVKGKACLGNQMPSENFQLAWINGFAINDRYPDNSTVASMASTITSDPTKPTTTLARGDSPNRRTLLSSASPATLTSDPQTAATQFHPSERFHNWIWHSKRHDELVYPAGSVVVLWSHWSQEQRYYAKHTTSVCCLALASLDSDLAASAQVQDPNGGPANAAVHLWSLTTLDTLRVLDDDMFRGLCLYSLKIRNTESEGCELTVGGREDKRQWLFVCFLNLKVSGDTKAKTNSDTTPTKQKPKEKPTEAFRVLKVSKPLQSNQLPLVLLRMSNVRSEYEALAKPSKSPQNPLSDVVLSFGRRHFQLWFTDRRRSELIPLQLANKTTEYCELMARATCLARLAPNELLVGDSTGNISLLFLGNVAAGETADGRKEPRIGKGVATRKYDIQTVQLFDAQQQAGSKQVASASVTCLSRVSGNLFASIYSISALYFWRLERTDGKEKSSIKCNQLCRIQLPPNLGFVCSFILSRYSRKSPSVEFYLVSTSNAILFGSANLAPGNPSTPTTENPAPSCCTLSVIYEGHETSAMSLVADCPPRAEKKKKLQQTEASGNCYFTCSLDYKICKWDGKALVWKSQLPSACASLAVHPIGFVLAIGSGDGTVYILDKISGLLISYFPLTPVCINCLAYSSDGSFLAAGCSNGSIFILPVYEQGLKYKKVSIFQSPHPVVSLQFSMDNKYILTSVTHGSYQELILWDLPNFRYMRDKVTVAADKIQWFDSICSGSEDVRAIWENANLNPVTGEDSPVKTRPTSNAASKKLTPTKRGNPIKNSADPMLDTIVNLSCHRLVRTSGDNFAVASDTRGYIRLFKYTCSDIDQGFYEIRVSSSPVNCCRFLANEPSQEGSMFVSSSMDGSICLWRLTKD